MVRRLVTFPCETHDMWGFCLMSCMAVTPRSFLTTTCFFWFYVRPQGFSLFD